MYEYPEIKAEIDALPWSSERLYDLVHMLNKPYDENTFISLRDECIFSKLDWHRNYRLTASGNKTFYKILTEGTFPRFLQS